MSKFLIQTIAGLVAAGVDFSVDSQVLDGDRWNEIVMPDQKTIIIIYDYEVCTYKWTGPQCEISLHNTVPTFRATDSEQLATWLAGWHPDGDGGDTV